MGSPYGSIEVRGARENNLMSYPSAQSRFAGGRIVFRTGTLKWILSSRPTRAGGQLQVAALLCKRRE
jgi:hypothetical protein